MRPLLHQRVCLSVSSLKNVRNYVLDVIQDAMNLNNTLNLSPIGNIFSTLPSSQHTPKSKSFFPFMLEIILHLSCTRDLPNAATIELVHCTNILSYTLFLCFFGAFFSLLANVFSSFELTFAKGRSLQSCCGNFRHIQLVCSPPCSPIVSLVLILKLDIECKICY